MEASMSLRSGYPCRHDYSQYDGNTTMLEIIVSRLSCGNTKSLVHPRRCFTNKFTSRYNNISIYIGIFIFETTRHAM